MLALICTALVPTAPATAAQTGSALSLGDWAVACDNGWRCEALLVNPLAHQNPSEPLRIVRLGGPDGELQLIFSSGAAEPEGKSFLPEMIEVAGGDDFDYLGRLPEQVGFNGNDVVFSGEAAITVLRIAAKGDHIRLIQKGGPSVSLSVSGLMAVLTYIDTVQHRVGNVTAIVARGSAPKDLVPPPPQLPVISLSAMSPKAPRRLSRAQLLEEHRKIPCGVVFKPRRPSEPDATYVRLDDRTTLALIEPICPLSNYNGFARVILIDETGNRRVAPIEGENAATGPLGDVLAGADWNAESRKMSSFGFWKGGCGGGTDYVWDGEKFRIIEEHITASCDLEIFSTLTLWRASVEPQ